MAGDLTPDFPEGYIFASEGINIDIQTTLNKSEAFANYWQLSAEFSGKKIVSKDGSLHYACMNFLEKYYEQKTRVDIVCLVILNVLLSAACFGVWFINEESQKEAEYLYYRLRSAEYHLSLFVDDSNNSNPGGLEIKR